MEIDRFVSQVVHPRARSWFETSASHVGYLSSAYQYCRIARTQRNLAIVERCRRPGVSTQTYLTPASRYRHPSINARVTELRWNRQPLLSHSRTSRLSIGISIQYPLLPGFFSMRACKLTRLPSVVSFHACHRVHVLLPFIYLPMQMPRVRVWNSPQPP